MKNIHILPTDKPSRLFKNIHSELLSIRKYDDKPLNEATQNQHIYITSDEEIKDGEYGICLNLVREGFKSHQAVFKMDAEQRQAMNELGGQKKAEVLKVILTTDQDLIKDGVQAIDDEFLEWFVNNPSCEEIYVNKIESFDFEMDKYVYDYKIIIPKEESKMTECYFTPKKDTSSATICNNCGQEKFVHTIGEGVKVLGYIINPKEEPKQETLEPLEVPIPIENKGVSNWNKSNTTPEFDGEYLCYISCKEECGNIHRYYKVVINTFNTWLINENERVVLWKELEENPFNH